MKCNESSFIMQEEKVFMEESEVVKYAKSGCHKCHGTGIRGHRIVGVSRQPVICPCAKRKVAHILDVRYQKMQEAKKKNSLGMIPGFFNRFAKHGV